MGIVQCDSHKSKKLFVEITSLGRLHTIQLVLRIEQKRIKVGSSKTHEKEMERNEKIAEVKG